MTIVRCCVEHSASSNHCRRMRSIDGAGSREASGCYQRALSLRRHLPDSGVPPTSRSLPSLVTLLLSMSICDPRCRRRRLTVISNGTWEEGLVVALPGAAHCKPANGRGRQALDGRVDEDHYLDI
jgi:hypothetical protein